MSFLAIVSEGCEYLNCLYGSMDIMHSEDVGSSVEGEGVEDGSAVEGFIGRRVKELPYHALS